MITESYIAALYSFVYPLIGLASRDRVRYTYGSWLDHEVGTDVFHDDVCNAWAVGTN